LILVASIIIVLLFYLRGSSEESFNERMLSAELALQNDIEAEFNRELLRASSKAASSEDWRRVLSLAARSIPINARSSDYRLFTVLAGRAASANDGNEDFLAYWLWGLLRGRNLSRVAKHAKLLSSSKWSSLAAEIRLETLPRKTEDSIKRFIAGDYSSSDPELFSRIAILTGSAELSFDAALLYMLNGEIDRAYEMAVILMSEDSGARRWSDRNLPLRRNVYTALAEIALDAGYKDSAINWLSLRLDDARRRRVVSWQNLGLLGDLYWDTYSLQANSEYRDLARNAWEEALELIGSNNGNSNDDSWRIWINLSTLEASLGNVRRSREILDEALDRFPDRSEVKAAWVRRHFNSEPALARRYIRQSDDNDPILGITAIDIDPKIISPQLYETRLWELFDMVTSKKHTVHETDAKRIAAFLLEFMSQRKDFSSIDIAIERYMRDRPHEEWILVWLLAADAVRGAASIDLIAKEQGGTTLYDDFRRDARLQNSWELLHDSALFAILASNELDEIARMYPDAKTGDFLELPELFETVSLDALEHNIDIGRIANHTLIDRVESIKKNRDDLVKKQGNLRAYGEKGMAIQLQANAALRQEAERLIYNALDDLLLAEKVAKDLSNEDRSMLLYLRAVVLKKIGRDIESRNIAEEATKLNFANTRAMQFLATLYDYD